jgi:tape measure domain-containing protein
MDNKLQYILKLNDLEFNRVMQAASGKTKGLDSSMDKLQSTISRVGVGLAGVFAVDKIIDFEKSVVNSIAKVQSFNNSILAASVSEEAGYENLRFLNGEIQRLGLNLDAARSGYKTFTGATMGTIIQGEKANKVFTQLAEASTVMGLSAEQQEGAFLALGQMISKGTVQAEELRGQLGERIPGAFQIGARAMGMTTQQLGKAMEQGLVKSEDFVLRFGNELQKTFGGKLTASVNSVNSNLNRMSAAWQMLQENIGTSQQGIIASTTAWVNNLLGELNRYFVQQNFISSTLQKRTGRTSQYGTGGAANEAEYDVLAQQVMGSIERSFKSKESAGKELTFLKNLGLVRGENFLKSKEFQGSSNENKLFETKRFNEKQSLIFEGIERIKKGIKGAEDLKTTKGEKSINNLVTGKSSGSLGSATEVMGARPQNINITVERLGETTFNNTNISGYKDEKDFANKISDVARKALLEVLNDANQMAR